MIWLPRFDRSLCLAGLKLGLVVGVSGCQDGGPPEDSAAGGTGQVGPVLFDEATGRLGI
jgi:hypothetical protein